MKEAEIPESVLAAVSDEFGAELHLVRQLAGGWNNGAILVSTGDRSAVLKTHGTRSIDELKAIQTATRSAAATGWPTPKLYTVGRTDNVVWSLQEFVEGSALETLTVDAATAVVEANRYQADLARGFPTEHLIDRSRVVHDMLTDRYGYLASLRSVSKGTNHLLQLLLDRSDHNAELRRNDLVHGDYNQENILLEGSTVTAFVDTDELGSGDRHFDLIDLFHRSLLRDGLEGLAGQNVLLAEIRSGLTDVAFWSCFATTAVGTMNWIATRMPERLSTRVKVLTDFVATT